jgi:hypothetical protein
MVVVVPLVGLLWLLLPIVVGCLGECNDDDVNSFSITLAKK